MINSYFLENGKLVVKPGYAEESQWVNIEGIGKEEFNVIRSLGLHELVIEDISHGKQRTKVDDYKDYLFITANAIEFDTAPISFFIILSKKRIINIASRQLRGDNKVAERLQKNSTLFSAGPDYILYLLLDSVADAYFPLLDEVDEEIEDAEKKLFSRPSKELSTKLLNTKRRTILFRKNLVELRDLVLTLRQFEGRFLNTKNTFHFQDVFDHLIRLSDKADLMRDIIATTFEGYLSVLSNNLNEIMKRLTALTVILMVPTLIAGIYGMNFIFLPASAHPVGFYIILGIMFSFGFILFWYFKKKKWL